jgi:hypothetical protein
MARTIHLHQRSSEPAPWGTMPLCVCDVCRADFACPVCVFITAGPITKLFAWGEGDSGGHVLRETTSRGRSGLVCPSRTGIREEPGTLTQGAPVFLWFLSFGNRTQNSRVAGARPNHQHIGGADPNHQEIRSPPRAGHDLIRACKGIPRPLGGRPRRAAAVGAPRLLMPLRGIPHHGCRTSREHSLLMAPPSHTYPHLPRRHLVISSSTGSSAAASIGFIVLRFRRRHYITPFQV